MERPVALTNKIIREQAKELREGETLSRSERLSLEDLDGKEVKRTLAKMRNSMNQIAAKSREETERGYRVESGQFLTYDGSAVVLTVTLTCMDDEGEDDI